MTATHGVGTYGNAAGIVTPLDHKMAQLGLVVKTAANTIRPGLFWDGSATIVSGKANMSYDVRALTAVLSRGATAGAVLLSNDAVFNVVTTAAPGSNSRYDLVYIWQREFSIDGTDSNPVIGVIQGTAAASPTVPSLAAFPGAIPLAQILVPAGVTATNSGTTITQTAPFTAAAGGVVPFRNATERDAGTYMESQTGWLIDSDLYQIYNGTAWNAIGTGAVVPTATSTGSIASDGKVTFTTAATIAIDVAAFTDDEYEFILDVTATSSTTVPTVQLRAAAANIGGTAYDYQNLIGSASSVSSSAITAQPSWQLSLTGTVLYSRIVLAGLGQTRAKIGNQFTYATQNPQTAPTVFSSGLQFRSTTTITGIAFIFTGGTATGSIRIRRKNV